MSTYCNSSTVITMHAKRYTKGELKGSWRGFLKITHRATIDGKEHVCRQYHWTPDYMGHISRTDALKAAEMLKGHLL